MTDRRAIVLAILGSAAFALTVAGLVWSVTDGGREQIICAARGYAYAEIEWSTVRCYNKTYEATPRPRAAR